MEGEKDPFILEKDPNEDALNSFVSIESLLCNEVLSILTGYQPFDPDLNEYFLLL
jgi:hypothetical protein